MKYTMFKVQRNRDQISVFDEDDEVRSFPSDAVIKIETEDGDCVVRMIDLNDAEIVKIALGLE